MNVIKKEFPLFFQSTDVMPSAEAYSKLLDVAQNLADYMKKKKLNSPVFDSVLEVKIEAHIIAPQALGKIMLFYRILNKMQNLKIRGEIVNYLSHKIIF